MEIKNYYFALFINDNEPHTVKCTLYTGNYTLLYAHIRYPYTTPLYSTNIWDAFTACHAFINGVSPWSGLWCEETPDVVHEVHVHPRTDHDRAHPRFALPSTTTLRSAHSVPARRAGWWRRGSKGTWDARKKTMMRWEIPVGDSINTCLSNPIYFLARSCLFIPKVFKWIGTSCNQAFR